MEKFKKFLFVAVTVVAILEGVLLYIQGKVAEIPVDAPVESVISE